MKKLLFLSCTILLSFAAFAQAPGIISASFGSGSIGPGQTTTLTITLNNEDFYGPPTATALASGSYSVLVSLPVSAPIKYELVAGSFTQVSPAAAAFTVVALDPDYAEIELNRSQALNEVIVVQFTIRGLSQTTIAEQTNIEIAAASDPDLTDNEQDPALSVLNLLPVDLTDFKGTTTNCVNTLQWTTANERNVANYEVEYSGDGIRYNKVGVVNSNLLNFSNQYKFEYKQATVEGFYRLKIIERNGHASHSDVIRLINVCAQPMVKLNPNPVRKGNSAILQIDNFDRAIVGTINTIDGKTLSTVNLKNGQNVLRTDNLPSGTYTLNVQDNLKNKRIIRFIVGN